jgi:hypothetical protein
MAALSGRVTARSQLSVTTHDRTALSAVTIAKAPKSDGE